MTLSASNENKADILNDHYKDTCLRLERYRKRRNRLVFYAAITMLITFFLQMFPTETLRIVASIFLRIGVDRVPELTDYSTHFARLFLSIVLLNIAFAFKHYRIIMDKQFAYVKMLESDLNSLYPKSNLFMRETNFSLKESHSFSIWDSASYSQLLKAGCYFLIAIDASAIIGFDNENYLNKVLAACVGILGTLFSFTYFATQKPITGANIISFLDRIVKIGQHTATQNERDDNVEQESRIWGYIVGVAIVAFWVITLIEYFCCTF